MVDFIQSARPSVLAIILATAIPASGQAPPQASGENCPGQTDEVCAEVAAIESGAADRSLVPTRPQSMPMEASSETPAEPSALALPQLEPTAPLPPSGQLPPYDELMRQLAPTAESEASPVVSTEGRGSEARLHAGLDWDVCGPIPGASGSMLGAPPDDANPVPVDITADRVDYDTEADLIRLRGDVEIQQEGQRLEADRSSYDQRSGQAHASGQVFLDYQGLRIQGDTADYNLRTKEGSVDQARYRMSGSANLRGTAKRANLLTEDRSRFEDLIYTTCPPGNSDWSIRASELELDQVTGLGTARHARVRVGDVPVLYTPYLRFPIDDRRRSGLLIPSFGSSSETGTDITIPYYWNIAPNMDATFIPRYMSTRGLMLGGQFRYLSSIQSLEVDAEILPHDSNEPDEGIRGALRVQQTGQLGSRWYSSVDYAAVSDDQYLQDFGNRLDVTSVRNLSQRADINYGGDGWSLLTRLQQFQTVDTSIAPVDRPYGQLPHIELNVHPQRWNELVEYRFEGHYDYFDHNSDVHGSRLVALPSVRVPLRRSFGYLIPRARLYYTGYDLQDQEAGLPERPSHLIPSLDIDGKLIFERETNWFGTNALQTLEPRLYYVLIPYEDQTGTPLFDTTALDFSFSSLFRPNRFTGYDRIGDENRLTLGLTSRTIANKTGRELLRASLGQIYYFDDRRVQLSGDSLEADVSSSVAGEFSARLHADWSARASFQWNPNETEQPWEKRVLQLRYAPDDDRLINLSYRFNFDDDEAGRYEDTDLSFQMPLGSRVRLVGRWLYSMLNDETIEAFAGVEFGRCCWRLRVLGQHLKTSSNSAGSTSVMLQLELAGLGSFGNSIDKLLEQGIYGYHTD